jgi:hypothetical protein
MDLTDREAPIWPISRTERREPKRDTPTTDSADPSLQQLLRESELANAA